jgi:Rrf2 family protein
MRCMKLSSGVEWGVHCCVVLSQASGPVPASTLAEFHGVSPTYLAKHLQALSRAGLVRSTPGQVGGYLLTREPDQITLLEVVEAIDGAAPAFRCTEIRQRGPLAAPRESCTKPCPIARAMAAAEQAWRSALGDVSIADLAVDVDAETGGTALAGLREWLAPAERRPA